MSLAPHPHAAMVALVRRVARFVPLFALLLGCHACGNTPADPAESPPDPRAERPSTDPSTVEPAEAAAPRVVVRGEPKEGGAVAIAIENRSDAPVSLSRDLIVEQRTGDSFTVVTTAGVTLRSSCEAEAPECITLVPGAELYPPDWLGTRGDAQCICTRCVPVEAGSYRFAITTCEGARIDGETFELAR
jgi:hypothetical protein